MGVSAPGLLLAHPVTVINLGHRSFLSCRVLVKILCDNNKVRSLVKGHTVKELGLDPTESGSKPCAVGCYSATSLSSFSGSGTLLSA